MKALSHSTLQSFQDYVRKMMHYSEAVALMGWDLRTGAPRKGHALRAEAIGTLSGEAFRMSTSEEMESYLEELSDPDTFIELNSINRALVRVVKKEFERFRKIPQERFEKYVVLVSQAVSLWEDAKHTSDFAMLKPYLEQIVAMKLEFIDYWGYGEDKYDTLLDQFEPGLTVRKLDQIFYDLRAETVDLVRAVVERGRQPDLTPFHRPFDIAKQKAFTRILLNRMGYDFAAGRLDETQHPFQTTLNRYDIRVTAHYCLNDFLSALFGTIHEGGHALYEQGISADLIGTPLCSGASMAIHESQSRFWENMIGRSHEFWEHNYSELQETFPAELADVTLHDFYRGINSVKPSLIRIGADEVTYNLHIMIRYEIEKRLFHGDIQVVDLPDVWREMARDYLGIVPQDDAHGVLQDIHWLGGDFGYFPSYSLGNIYAAQFRNTMLKEVPDFHEHVRNGELDTVKTWLNEKIHTYGRMLEPAEIVRQVTGEELRSKYLVSYFKEKYGDIYHL